jgi:pimeloyl-ACP methyl ester carboxylesterase
MRTIIVEHILQSLIVTDRTRGMPIISGVKPITTTARDGVEIAGWRSDPHDPPRGTVLFLHGFTQHCASPRLERIWTLAKRWRDERSLIIAACDLRGHGRSTGVLPSFGLHESWDARSFIEYFRTEKLPKPWIVIGYSLGAMAAQRLAIDCKSVDAVACIAPPATPAIAMDRQIRKVLEKEGCLTDFAVAAGIDAMKAAHGGSAVFERGDITTCAQADEPLVCYLMGDGDHYGHDATREIWRHWYQAAPPEEQRLPSPGDNQRSWFVTAHGCDHFAILNWPDLHGLLDVFLASSLADYGHTAVDTEPHRH